jgi:predicted alpha/beta superfamily hydrolase
MNVYNKNYSNIAKGFLTKFTFLFVIFISSCQKTDVAPNEINLDQTTISSINTGSTYPIYIIKPIDYSTSKKYETIYVLDGDDDLNGLKIYEQVAVMCLNSSRKFNKENVIIVAISSLGQDERFRDYAPVPGTTPPKGLGGGTENYTKFIENELIPYIETNYSVDTIRKSRTICGHSLGGSVTGYFFTKHPDVFSNYLTLSPAFWWGDGTVMQYEKNSRDNNIPYNTLVFVGCGEMEEGIRIYANDWYYRLQTFYPNCTSKFNVVKNAGHITSAKENLTEAIDFYFNLK